MLYGWGGPGFPGSRTLPAIPSVLDCLGGGVETLPLPGLNSLMRERSVLYCILSLYFRNFGVWGAGTMVALRGYSGARLSTGYHHDCPRPRGRGRRPEAGRGGGYGYPIMR